MKQMARRVKELEMPAVALTDHGNMSGAVQLWSKCADEGVKPIVGCEVYIALGDMNYKKREKGVRNYHHFVLLAMNDTGYKNLCKIVSAGYTQGFYYKPRVDKAFIKAHSEGLFASSACIGSEIAQTLWMAPTDDEAIIQAVPIVNDFVDMFGENFRLELQDHGIPEQHMINMRMIKLAQVTGVKLLWTNDSHFLRAEDFEPHKALVCVARRGKESFDSMDHVYKADHAMKSTDEMLKLVKNYPADVRETIIDSMRESERIAEQCDFSFTKGTYYFPKYDVAEGETTESVFRRRCQEGMARMRRTFVKDKAPEYSKRLIEEQWLIAKMGFESYFLLVADAVTHAKENDIPVGPGRGSVGGSLVAYVLGITDVDPIRHGLLFERFLNPERISMPDIDMDFGKRRRGEMVQYLSDTYGAENVAQIATFGTLQPKAAINDVGRVLGYPLSDTRKLSALCPGTGNKPVKLVDAVQEHKPLKDIFNSKNAANATAKRVLELAVKLEGANRQVGTHAAGVVVTPTPISDYCPVWYLPKKGVTMAGFDMSDLETIGLVKLDFLGLKTLDVISDTIKLINKYTSDNITLESIGYLYDDSEVYRHIFAHGNTKGVFQFESPGMRSALMQLMPDRFDDIVAMNALYRPGPKDSGMMDSFIKRKNGREEVEAIHEELTEILSDTYGVIVYQEQVMHALQRLGGLSLGQADVIRKAMGKKNIELMEKEMTKFIDAAVAQGWQKTEMITFGEDIKQFARYGFNRAHAVEYSAIAYQTAWLKHYYPVFFMTALLTAEAEDNKPEKVQEYMAECVLRGIEILPPDVNYSGPYFTYENGKIRFGLAAICHVGHGVAEDIQANVAKNGEFKSFPHFVSRLNLSSKTIDALIKAGATESLGGHRGQHMASYPDILKRRRKNRVNQAQDSIFSRLTTDEVVGMMDDDLIEADEWSKQQIRDGEFEAAGMYITDHPMDDVPAKLLEGKNSVADVNEIFEDEDARDRAGINMVGVIMGIEEKLLPNGSLHILKFEDRSGRMEMALWEDKYKEAEQFMAVGNIIQVVGNIGMTKMGVKRMYTKQLHLVMEKPKEIEDV
jgi:DNA polymerase-3 subunit alpha